MQILSVLIEMKSFLYQKKQTQLKMEIRFTL